MHSECVADLIAMSIHREYGQAQSLRSLLQLRRQIDTLRLSLVITGNAARQRIDAAPKSGSLTISTLLANPNAASSGDATSATATQSSKCTALH